MTKTFGTFEKSGAQASHALCYTNVPKLFYFWQGGSRGPGAIFQSGHRDGDVAIHPVMKVCKQRDFGIRSSQTGRLRALKKEKLGKLLGIMMIPVVGFPQLLTVSQLLPQAPNIFLRSD